MQDCEFGGGGGLGLLKFSTKKNGARVTETEGDEERDDMFITVCSDVDVMQVADCEDDEERD